MKRTTFTKAPAAPNLTASLLALLLLAPGATAQLVQNGGFEQNFPTSPASGGVFGPTTVKIFDPYEITGWQVDVYDGQPQIEWIEAAGYGAGGSDHFVYVPAGNGFCVEPRPEVLGMVAGQKYSLTVSLASADADVPTNLWAHLSSQANGWHPLYDVSGTQKLEFTATSPISASAGNPNLNGLALGPNTAWLDGTPTTIPWTSYTYVFSAPTSYWDVATGQVVNVAAGQPLAGVTFDFCTSGNGSGAFVIDNVQLTAVPEPGVAALLAGAAFFGRRCRRSVGE